jgi:putative transposase
MIDRNHDLPIIRQAKALNISRGSVYYKRRPVSAEDLALMRRIDELHLEYPFAGSRMLRDFLNREGVEIGRRHVATLMKRMGMEAIYRRPNTSKPAPGNKIYPYLLRGLKVDRPNQVWAMDISRRLRSNRPDLYPDGARLCLFGRRRRLVQPARA